MAQVQVGDRVIALRNTDNENKIAYSFGEGVYVGKRETEILGMQIDNHCIELDNGSVVFGHQCWWGSEQKVKSRFKDFTFEEVSLTEEVQ